MAISIKNLNQQRADFEKFYQDHSPAIERDLRIALADINIFCGPVIENNTRAACQKGLALISSGYFRKALVLNCSSNQRWAMRIARTVANDTTISNKLSTPVCVMGMPQGMLSRQLANIREYILQAGVDVILINSWEFSSCNARFREELIFALRGLMEDTNVTVIIFSQANVKEFKPGTIMRGTLGRLSALASTIAPVENSDDESIAKPETVPITPDDHSEVFVDLHGTFNTIPNDDQAYQHQQRRELALAA